MDAKNNPCWFLSVLFIIFSFKTHLTIAADTLSAGQSLTGIQTLVSKDGNFELGFFTPGKSLNYYLGIWYKKVSFYSRTPVWVANRDEPLDYQSSSELRLLRNGNLVLFNKSNQIWSTNSTSNTLKDPLEAVLGDDGNLVVRDGSNPSVVIWQSFDYPTDTWLPGMKLGLNKRTNKRQVFTSWRNLEDPAPGLFSMGLDPNGTQQFIINWNSSTSFWTSGLWNGQIFSLVPEMSNILTLYNYSFIDNVNERYFTYTYYNRSIISRFVLEFNGQLRLLTWSDANLQWNLFWSQPRYQCDVYGICGAFSSCNSDTLKCDCLSGFEKRYSKDWDLGDSTGGCVRNTSLQCGEKYVFSQIPKMKTAKARSAEARSAEECESACSSNCSCNAYSYESNRCSLLDGDLLNLVQLSDGGENLFLRLAASDIGTSKGKKIPIWKFFIIIPIFILGTSILGVLGYMYLLRRKANQRGKSGTLKQLKGVLIDLVKTKDLDKESPNANMFKNGENKGETPELQLFDFALLAIATNNFCLTNKLGQGGFGPVYKGQLQNGQDIAVKRLSKSSGQGIEEFKNEVVLISKLQHRNLVRLLGCCIEGEEYMLVYEYMPNKSLDAFLFDEGKKVRLDWNKRFNIIHGIARGLLYLHRDSRLKIIHRDLKVSNILLDEDMNPKISDFGMARIFGGNQTMANTNRVVGTFGYMSPEYIMGGTFSDKSDVFSFGVLLLEILSSKRNNSFYHPDQPLNLILHAWRLWNEGKWSEIVDEALVDSYSPLEMVRCIHVGLLCVQKRAVDRPTMATVDLMLGSETNRPTPKEPPFISETSSDSDFLQIRCSNNNVTITMVEAR